MAKILIPLLVVVALLGGCAEKTCPFEDDNQLVGMDTIKNTGEVIWHEQYNEGVRQGANNIKPPAGGGGFDACPDGVIHSFEVEIWTEDKVEFLDRAELPCVQYELVYDEDFKIRLYQSCGRHDEWFQEIPRERVPP